MIAPGRKFNFYMALMFFQSLSAVGPTTGESYGSVNISEFLMTKKNKVLNGGLDKNRQ
jgi:hypothetical protein